VKPDSLGTILITAKFVPDIMIPSLDAYLYKLILDLRKRYCSFTCYRDGCAAGVFRSLFMPVIFLKSNPGKELPSLLLKVHRHLSAQLDLSMAECDSAAILVDGARFAYLGFLRKKRHWP